MAERKERKDAAQHHRIILQKASALFAEHGVDSVSMSQIAKAAGIGQGTLYRRYAHKGELCMDLMEESSRRLREDIELYLLDSAKSTTREKLENILKMWLNFIEEQSLLLGSIHAPTCAERRSILYLSPLYEFIHVTISTLLRQTMPHGGVPSMDCDFAADAIIASTAPDLYMFQRQVRGYSMNDIIGSLHSLYLDPLFREL